MNSTPLISIICCTHNRLEFVRKHLAALRVELPREVELIYALDNCADATQDHLLEHGAGLLNLRVLDYRGVGGLFNCRNHGLQFAQGRFIHFLDDDDGVEPGYYRRLCDLLRGDRLGQVDAYITGILIDVAGQSSSRRPVLGERVKARAVQRGDEWDLRGDMFAEILTGDIYFNCANAIFSREFFARHGFRGDFKKSADWLLYLEAALTENLRVIVNETLQANYMIHASSMSVAPDKSYWNARIFDTLLNLAPEPSPHHRSIKTNCAQANFAAGYAYRYTDKQKAFKHYARALRLGLVGKALLGMAKLPLQH